MADEPREHRASPHPESANADELAARLADVHRRTEELAAQVAEFRAETEQLAADVDPSGNGDAPVTADLPEHVSDASADGPDQVGDASADGAERGSDAPATTDAAEASPEPAVKRRHRPRPSLSAPLVYDDGGAAPSAPSGPSVAPDTGNGAGPPKRQADEPAAKPPRKADKAQDRTDKPEKNGRRGLPGWVRRLRTFVIVVVVAIAAALALRTWVVAPYYVPSASMEPTLHGCDGCNDDHVLVEKLSYDFHDPSRGDIVVFSNPGKKWSQAHDKTLIKRVIGVAGDRIVIRDRHVFVNGARLDESYVKKSCKGTLPGSEGRSVRVPKGDLWVMGDNRCNSEDSRVFGPVPLSDVIGRAFLIIWPLSRFGPP